MMLSAILLLAGQVAPAGAPAATAQPAAAAAEAKCDRPVFLVVSVDHLDRTKSKAYAEGLRNSGIVRRNGGRYRVAGAPLLTLEGAWPADRGFVIEQYPCRAAFEAMWYSDEYQHRLKPLRDNSGDYTITLFNTVAEPAPSPSK